ncbi:MAG: BsaA family SipW-dependent biofilm matrix protein [Propionibacteriaceae bacterium]|jgi:alternate signal-mediated exported protein|nr:BsaA family SipW-dependent biofilm matrix protein [Propionibacteriaceae bacterium]
MKKPLALGVAGVLAVSMAVSATFAWFTSNQSVTNHLETADIDDGSVTIVEAFDPPKEWKPGQSVTKQVAVANNGSKGDVLVRITFEEAMKLNGEAKQFEKQYGQLSEDDQKKHVPALFNAAQYLTNDWEAVPSKDIEVVGKLPDGLEVRAKCIDSSAAKKVYNFVALHKMTDGAFKDQYQKVTANFSLVGGKLTVDNVVYHGYAHLGTVAKMWAKVEPPTLNNPVPTLDTPARDQIGFPRTDPNKKISLLYHESAKVSGNSANAGGWWYDDGFFYYLKKLSPGEITAPLLTGLKLDETAGREYANMSFDLVIDMQAIQNTESAITSDTGWGITSAALLAELKKLCA